MDGELCHCGSGRRYATCHGARGPARRARGLELEVLGDLKGAGIMFPFLRPKDVFIDEFAWRIASAMAGPRDITGAEAREGLELLPAEERSRIVRMWEGRYPHVWASICGKVGDEALAETTLVASAVRGAVADRVPPRRELLAMLEDGSFAKAPLFGPAWAIQPETVWLYEEARWGGCTITRAHFARLRTQLSRLASRLPIDGLPVASQTLRQGCELADHELAQRRVALLLYDKYRLLLEDSRSYSTSRN